MSVPGEVGAGAGFSNHTACTGASGGDTVAEMLASCFVMAWLSVAPAAPGEPLELGPFRIEQRSSLQWPGLLAPSVDATSGPRWVYRYSLGFKAPSLRSFALDIYSLGPSGGGQSSAPLQRTAAPPSLRLEAGLVLPGPLGLKLSTVLNAAAVGVGRAAMIRRGSKVLNLSGGM